jgi:hypothetical protein
MAWPPLVEGEGPPIHMLPFRHTGALRLLELAESGRDIT